MELQNLPEHKIGTLCATDIKYAFYVLPIENKGVPLRFGHFVPLSFSG